MASSSEPESTFEPLKHWLKSSGATGLETVELAEFPPLGRGIKALKHFKKGEKILTVPQSVLWTVENAYSDPLLGPALSAMQSPLTVDDTLATYILFIKSRISGYDELQSHVSALPTSYSSTIFFSNEELEVCAGTSLYTITKHLERQIEGDHRELLRRIHEVKPDLIPIETITLEDYKWALCTVWSRAMDFQLANGSSLRLIAPFIDMLNHSSEIGQCHVWDTTSRSLSVLAGKDYEIGDQIFIFYGSIPNNRLLRLYGFVIPGNPNDSYDLVLTTHPLAPLFKQKLTLWKLAGMDSATTIPLTLVDPLPKDVLRYLRIQRLDEMELATALMEQKDIANRKISDKNEIEILRFLISSIHDHLENFGTQLETLEKQLANGHYLPGGNAWAAAQVSVGEQKVLRLAKESAEHLLKAEESGQLKIEALSLATTQCANCETASDHLKLCARCKTVAYCERACQVAHYQKHKSACRAKIRAQ